jgi:hypothetical protein
MNLLHRTIFPKTANTPLETAATNIVRLSQKNTDTKGPLANQLKCMNPAQPNASAIFLNCELPDPR